MLRCIRIVNPITRVPFYVGETNKRSSKYRLESSVCDGCRYRVHVSPFALDQIGSVEWPVCDGKRSLRSQTAIWSTSKRPNERDGGAISFFGKIEHMAHLRRLGLDASIVGLCSGAAQLMRAVSTWTIDCPNPVRGTCHSYSRSVACSCTSESIRRSV